MKVQIYHNPRCSKSRNTLGLLEEHGISPEVVEYLKDTPSKSELKKILKLLGLKPRDLMRKGEDEYKAQNLADESLSDDALIDAMLETPKLIERPIVVVDGKKAVIGRPPENVLEII
ncbi:MAG: arsenate reductase (glutaredoxin) [Gammaproteobacteria bacterium]|nr:arsenate reductase (glutaredoxin) [Gammaproteobacteria bacterium]